MFAENTIKIVFSAEHSFCVSQIVNPPFEVKPKMALLQPKVSFWVFPRAFWNPYFCSVWWLWMGTKKDHFPKTDSCNENARFLPSEHKQCLPIFNAISAKISFLFTTTPKHMFSVYFLKFWQFAVREPNNPETAFLCFGNLNVKVLKSPAFVLCINLLRLWIFQHFVLGEPTIKSWS